MAASSFLPTDLGREDNAEVGHPDRVPYKWKYGKMLAMEPNGSVIDGSCSVRAVKSVSWRVPCKMEVTRVEQRVYIKIAFLRERNAVERHSELVEALEINALSYRTVARWIGKFQYGRVSTNHEQRSG
ncbi:HTH_48 domain-containing protein [Trichonephila clavipes]|nr:HTH_48 domain-containing protein [Trichonephila clavipes]